MYGVLENFENLILFTFSVNSLVPKGAKIKAKLRV